MIELWLQLFGNFFQIGILSIGGGYAMIPFIQSVVTGHGWMTPAEVADMVAISQMTPGPFAVNAATFVGMRMGGWPAAVFATLGITLPSVILISIIVRFFDNFQTKPSVQGVLSGIRPVVAGLIAAATWSIAQTALFASGNLDILAIAIAAGTVWVLQRWKIHPIWIIVASGALGLLYLLW